MKITTTTNIIFQHEMYPEGTQLDLTEVQAQSLINQGVAVRVKRTIEIEDEDQTPTAAPEATKNSQPSKHLSKMNRTELEAVAEARGMTDLGQYETVADLRKTIEANKGGAA